MNLVLQLYRFLGGLTLVSEERSTVVPLTMAQSDMKEKGDTYKSVGT